MVIMRKMKEKCKDAARMRREKERVEFVELSKLLPLPSSTTSQLDKASIIRLTSSYLRMRSAFPQGLGENWGNKQSFLPFRHAVRSKEPVWPELFSDHTPASAGNVGNSSQLWNQVKELGSLLLQTLDGFVFALHRDGKIMYISETASVHLGLPQIDLTGSSVFDYIHPADHNDIMDILDLSESERAKLAEQFGGPQTQDHARESDETIELGRSFCMRMKCVLPKRNAGLVSNGYKAIHCSGYLKAGRRRPSSTFQKTSKLSETHLTNQKVWDSYALVAVGHSLLSTASTEIKLDAKTFMFRANLDLRLHFIETLATSILGYQQSDLVCQSLYQFVHVADLHCLELAHKQVLDKGQVVSKYYRLMRQGGGCVWVQTYATIINNPRSMPKPQHIVGICRVIGESHCDDLHLLLARDPAGQTEFTSSIDKKTSEQSLDPINSQSWIGQTTSGAKSSARLINRCNRGQKRAAFRQQQQSGRTSRSYEFKRIGVSRTSLDICSGKFAGNSLRTIGSMRRTSDDSCSIVSSVASSTSRQSTSGQCSNGSNQTANSPPYHPTSSDPTYPHKITSVCLQDYENAALFEPAPVSQHTNQYSNTQIQGHSDKCESQDYWSRCGRQSDGTTFSISMNTSIDQSQRSWPDIIATTVSPTLTTSTAALSQASADSSPAGVCTLSPRRAYSSEQYHYRLYGQEVPCDSYHIDDYNASYLNGSQVYMDYSDGHANLMPMHPDDQMTQTFYYTPHQETSYLTGNSSA